MPIKKFYQLLNQQPKSAKQNGKHRKPSAPSHGHPADRAGAGPGGPAFGTLTTSTGWLTIGSTWGTVTNSPDPPAIPYAGIRTGELIGYRYWWLIKEHDELHLCSVAHRRLWVPFETVWGDVTKRVVNSQNIFGGVYGFSSPGGIWPEVDAQADHLRTYKRFQVLSSDVEFNPYRQASGVIYGTIKMWGEVVEHETGYRAEYAKVQSIDGAVGDASEVLEAVKARYLPSPQG